MWNRGLFEGGGFEEEFDRFGGRVGVVVVRAGGADGGAEIIREIREVVIGEIDESIDTLSLEGDKTIIEGVATSGELIETTREGTATGGKLSGAVCQVTRTIGDLAGTVGDLVRTVC